MPKSSQRKSQNDWGVMELARDNPLAAAAAAAGAAAAGLFLWSRRAQISSQLNQLSDQIGEWKSGQSEAGDDTAGLTTAVTQTNRRSSRSRSRQQSPTT